MVKTRYILGMPIAALMFLNAGAASAVPYANGLVLPVADLTFTFNSCSVAKSATGAVGTTLCSQIKLDPVTSGSGTLLDPYLYGFGINGLIAALTPGSFMTITMKYSVDIAPGMLISDVHLSQTGAASALAHVDEILMNGLTPEGALHTTGLAPVAGALTAQLVSHLDVTKIYGVSYDSVGHHLVQMSAINQLFSQVPDRTTHSTPEPATLALFGAGLAGLGAKRRRRKNAV